MGDCVELPRQLTTAPIHAVSLHNGQVFAEIHVDDGAFPGADTLRADALAECKVQAQTYLGKPSLLHIVAFFAPDDRSCNLGDTSQLCVLVDRQNDITGDIRRYA